MSALLYELWDMESGNCLVLQREFGVVACFQ